jgi:hypothetical protein
MSDTRPAELLRRAKLVVSPETFHVASIDHQSWNEILADPALSPLMRSEFLLFKDKWEVTLVLDSQDFANISRGLRNAKVENGFRLLSFDIEMDFDVVGFMAAVAGVMAESGISILPFSSFSRDHILIRQEDLASALKAFSGIVDEVC